MILFFQISSKHWACIILLLFCDKGFCKNSWNHWIFFFPLFWKKIRETIYSSFFFCFVKTLNISFSFVFQKFRETIDASSFLLKIFRENIEFILTVRWLASYNVDFTKFLSKYVWVNFRNFHTLLLQLKIRKALKLLLTAHSNSIHHFSSTVLQKVRENKKKFCVSIQ